MVGKVAERREARTQEIVDAAWKLAAVEGIGGFSLHGLARALGIRQPSLYEYFDSKLALYDAMFADGNRRLLARLDAVDLPDDPRHALQVLMRAFVEFAVEDIARQELLFARPIPGFAPSPEAYAPAVAVLERSAALLRAAGMRARGDADCFTAMVGGLIAAQNSNDPGGNRWVRHLDRLIDLYLDHLPQRRAR
ncbi:MAG TPA: TetR/AcrR family transcriptional regulator [Acidimicrobiia bacterium]|nr:TetR/AcrR family transcriptional regulator [Acidimicrobiia bacterium]